MNLISGSLFLALFGFQLWGANAPTLSVALRDEQGMFQGDEPLRVTFMVTNNADETQKLALVTEIRTDDGKPVTTLTKSLSVAARKTQKVPVMHKVSAPGIYRIRAFLRGAGQETFDPPDERRLVTSSATKACTFNLAYEPDKMQYTLSAPPDFEAFWQAGKDELARVAPEYTMKPLKTQGTVTLYDVRMKSVGNVTVGGRLAKPAKAAAKSLPAEITFLGYGSSGHNPPCDNPNMIRYVASTRGQGIFKSQNKYGEWMTYRLDDPKEHYYRGAMLDLLRAVDFVCSLPEVDPGRILVNGVSQGGAFSIACAALDHRIDFCIPIVPGPGEFPKMIQLTRWPGEAIYQRFLRHNKDGVTAERMAKTQAYFDTKNFAPLIACPVFMGAGLQDPICVPRVNFAAYTQIKTPKWFILYPETEHAVRWGDFGQHAFGKAMRILSQKQK